MPRNECQRVCDRDILIKRQRKEVISLDNFGLVLVVHDLSCHPLVFFVTIGISLKLSMLLVLYVTIRTMPKHSWTFTSESLVVPRIVPAYSIPIPMPKPMPGRMQLQMPDQRRNMLQGRFPLHTPISYIVMFCASISGFRRPIDGW